MELKVTMTKVTVAVAAAAMLSGSLAAFAGQVTKHSPKTAAHAAPKADVFNRNTETNSPPAAFSPVYAPQAANVPSNINSDKSVATRWFEGFDWAIATHLADPGERLLLNKPFNQDKDRVIAWTNTAAKVAQKYHELARILRETQVPPGMLNKGRAGMSVRDYAFATAEWYEDSAKILEDWIRPRKPARTQEELDGILAQMRERSDAQKRINEQLHEIDTVIRNEYNVHMARHDDAIWSFATKTPESVQREKNRQENIQMQQQQQQHSWQLR